MNWGHGRFQLWRQLFKFNLFLMLIMGIARILFLFVYGQDILIQRELANDLLKSFILGFRFDLTVVGYINSVILLLTLFFHQLIRTWSIYFTFFSMIVIYLSGVDFGYYSYFQDRINIIIFGFFQDDTQALIKTMWENYPSFKIIIALVLITYLIRYWTKSLFSKYVFDNFNLESTKVRSAQIFIILLFSLIAARGSFGLFPLSEIDLGFSKNQFINLLSSNSPRALARAIEVKIKQNSEWDSNLKAYGYHHEYKKAFADYFHIDEKKLPVDPMQLIHHRTPKNEWAEKNKPNVIIIVMESFGAYWLKYNQEPFNLFGPLEKHFQEDLYLDRFVSTTGATIGSLSSLIAGIHQRPISEFLTESDFLLIPLSTAPAPVFKKNGYHTRFIYGGNPGWREINRFASVQGFDSIEGEHEIERVLNQRIEKHDWGVYDEDLWQYLNQTLNKKNGKPEFVVVMTTTNHPPYQLPSTHKNIELKIPIELKQRLNVELKLAQDRFQTYRYSNDQLALFLDQLKSGPKKDQSIVAVTGDHNFWIVPFSDQQILQKSAVPFYLYTPSSIQKKLPQHTFGSQPDILPTLYELALSKAEYDSFNLSLFSKDRRNYSMHSGHFIAGPEFAAIIGSDYLTQLKWSPDQSELLRNDQNQSEQYQAMAKYYRGLMASLDYYLLMQKEKFKKSK